MVPGNIENSFEENLQALPDYDKRENVIKIVIPKGLRKEALHNLYNMNILRTSLFPGLDGYASSLGVIGPVHEPVNWSGRGDYHISASI